MSKDLFNGNAGDRSDDTAWELRPGGMVVQRREDGIEDNNGPILRVKVSFGNSQHEVSIPAHATFGDLKTLLAQVTCLEPQDQRILFRGKEKESDEYLHIAGVQDSAKLILLEDPARKERKMEGMKMNPNVSKACEAIAAVRAKVDKLSGHVAAIESAVNNGTKVEEKNIIVLTEMLMIQLLKLDGIEAEGEAKALRKVEITTYSAGVSVVMQGHNIPTYIAHPDPGPFPSEAICWPIHEQGYLLESSSFIDCFFAVN